MRTVVTNEAGGSRRFSVEGDAIPYFLSTARVVAVMVLQIASGTVAGLLAGIAPLWAALPISMSLIASAVWCYLDFRRFPHPSNTVITFSPALAYVGGVALATTLIVRLDLFAYLK